MLEKLDQQSPAGSCQIAADHGPHTTCGLLNSDNCATICGTYAAGKPLKSALGLGNSVSDLALGFEIEGRPRYGKMAKGQAPTRQSSS